jgi:hypothetical protein
MARMYGRKTARSPWAVCRAQENKTKKKTGKRWSKKKFERCVLKVKKSR